MWPSKRKGGLTQSVSKAFLFETRLKCNETHLHVFQMPTAKIISGTNIIIPQKSGMVIRLWFLKTKIVALKSWNSEVETEIKIKIKQINLIIQFCNKAKIFLLFDVKSGYISCTSRKQRKNRKKHVSQVSHDITSMCWCRLRQHMHKLKYISDLISYTYLTFLLQKSSRNYISVKVESYCKWSMLACELQLLTLFLHCVFVFSFCGFPILKTSGFTSFSTLTQSNFAICSLRFLSNYQKMVTTVTQHLSLPHPSYQFS